MYVCVLIFNSLVVMMQKEETGVKGNANGGIFSLSLLPLFGVGCYKKLLYVCANLLIVSVCTDFYKDKTITSYTQTKNS